jgi:hypothetical protein
MKKIVILVASICLFHTIIQAQAVLKGKIVDSATAKPLGYATITVFKALDTAIVTYRLSTPGGDFKVTGLPLDMNCRVVISYSGYSVYRKGFLFSSAKSTIDLGTIQLVTNARSLDEVLVIAERPPVVIKKDTIEFNASAFRTLPNAMVEDLLKKLPGVMVDKDGGITVNGKPVNRILVDGKTFFGDDPRMATRNLPANAIDKVQVSDDKEEMMRNGDDNPNNVGKVINLTFKKGIKKGWFGKLYAGAGSDKLYEAGGIANIYRDTLQLSVLAYMNNLNRAGFSYSELMQSGGFDRVRSNSASNSTSQWNNNGGSGISINGINFGGSQSFGGIATSRGAGLNLNHAPNKKKSFYFQFFNGNVSSDRMMETDVNQYKSDTIINTNTQLTGDYITHTNNIGVGAKLKPDSVTNILFNASYLIGLQDEDRFSDIIGSNNKTGPLSAGDVDQLNDGNLYIYRHSIAITTLSRTKAGRRFNFNHNLEMNNRYNDYTSSSLIHYAYPASYDSAYSQLRNERIPRTDAFISFNYSEPLNKHFAVRIGGRYEYSRLNNGVSTYNKKAGSDKFDQFNNLLSSKFKRISNRLLFIPGLEYKWKELTVTPAIRVLEQLVDNRLISSAILIRQKQFDILPALTVVYKQLTFNYNRDILLPGFSSLNPVADISNPYFITKGNPNLVSSVRNGFSINYFKYDPKKFINVSGWTNAAFTNRDIIPAITIDDRGVQTSIPVNANGTSNVSMNWNINKQYKNKQNVIFIWNTGNWMSVTKSRLLFNGIESWQTTFIYNHWFGAGLNLNDKFEWNISYGFGKNFTHYTSPYFQKLNVGNYDAGTDMVLRWPKHLIWETQLNYSYNNRIPAGMPRETVRWNAALNITMFKNEVGVLKLFVNDILNRNNSISVNVNRNIVTTSRNNILGRYFLATFTYNVRPAGAKKRVGGRDRLFMF